MASEKTVVSSELFTGQVFVSLSLTNGPFSRQRESGDKKAEIPSDLVRTRIEQWEHNAAK